MVEAIVASSKVERTVLSPSTGKGWMSGNLFSAIGIPERADPMTRKQELMWSDPMLVCGICECLDAIKIFLNGSLVQS